MCEETVGSSRFFNWLPAAVLRSIVHGDGAAHLLREVCKPFLNYRTGRSSAFVFEFCDEHESSLPFNECVDARCMVTGFHRVALPVSNAGSAVNDCGAYFDGRTLWLQDSLASSRAMWNSPFASSPQAVAQVFAPTTHPAVPVSVHLRVDELVNGFVGDCLTQLALDDARNLFRCAPALQLSRDKD